MIQARQSPLAIELCRRVLTLVLVLHVLLQHAVNVVRVPRGEQRVKERHEKAVNFTPQTWRLSIGHWQIGIGCIVVRGRVIIVVIRAVIIRGVVVGCIRCRIVVRRRIVIVGPVVVIRGIVIVGVVVRGLWHAWHDVHCAHRQETGLISFVMLMPG